VFGKHMLVPTVLAALLVGALTASAASGNARSGPTLLLSGLGGGSGSTVGPHGDLYVTDTVAGKILRVDPHSGAATTFADCLPKQLIGIGGAMDVAFRGRTAYALVTLVDSQLGGSSVDGIYRIDGPHTCTVVTDIGAWAIAHPPCCFDFFVLSGVQYAMQPYKDGFLVTDGHHNRVLRARLNGSVSEIRAFDDIVPTGLERRGKTIYVAEAGPVPHLPENGKIVSFDARSSGVKEVASGGRLLVDVEFGPGKSLFALAQGHFTPGHDPGSPADPDTGQLLKVHGHGFSIVASALDRPTSLEVIGETAYVVTLDGEIWKIEHIDGKAH